MTIGEDNNNEALRSDTFDSGIAEERETLAGENKALKQRVNELTALTYQVVNHFENEFFTNQGMLRQIRDRLVMTPDVWAIVNKSKEPPEQSSIS